MSHSIPSLSLVFFMAVVSFIVSRSIPSCISHDEQFVSTGRAFYSNLASGNGSSVSVIEFGRKTDIFGAGGSQVMGNFFPIS